MLPTPLPVLTIERVEREAMARPVGKADPSAWGVPSWRIPPYLKQAREDALRLGIPKAAYMAFAAQSRRAQQRGIAWEFTLPEWWDWWQTDGRWDRRGRTRISLVMARNGDAGPYSPTNTYCTTASGNTHDVPFAVRSAACLAAWHGSRVSHLSDRANHPQNKPVMTPKGHFVSATLAAEAYGVAGCRGRRWAREGRNGWHYAV